MRLLAKDPNDRYPSAEDLRADLRRFREGQPVLAAGAAPPPPRRRPRPSPRRGPPPPCRSPRHRRVPDRRLRRRLLRGAANRTGWFIAGLVVLVALLAGLLAIFANALGIGGDDGVEQVEVPGVILMTEAQATALEGAGFEVEVEYVANVDHEPGIVFQQDPGQGSMEPRGHRGHHRQCRATRSSPCPSSSGSSNTTRSSSSEAEVWCSAPSSACSTTTASTARCSARLPCRRDGHAGNHVRPVVSRGPSSSRSPTCRGEALEDAVASSRRPGSRPASTRRTPTRSPRIG
jgi:eukaryotic-like serine/threonine-protein kinase